jgi:hypothetical protein
MFSAHFIVPFYHESNIFGSLERELALLRQGPKETGADGVEGLAARFGKSRLHWYRAARAQTGRDRASCLNHATVC